MKAENECLPCLVRQARELAAMTTDDNAFRLEIFRECFEHLSDIALDRSPPEIARETAEIVRSITGVEDPYKEVKNSHTELALKMIPEMDRIIEQADDKFLTGLKLAIAGNIIDLGAREQVSNEDIDRILHEVIHEPLSGLDPRLLERRLKEADSVLYLADNAGETVFDRKFLEQLPREKITLAVRGGPAINDATLEDARSAGLDEVVTLIENGSNVPATVLSDCSPEFRRFFEEADLIIAKGQGNYESLSESDREIFFLFRVKCDLVARHSGYPIGSLVLLSSEGLEPA